MKKMSNLDIIRSEREFGTEQLTVNITKSTLETIYWAAKNMNIEYDEAIEILILEGSKHI